MAKKINKLELETRALAIASMGWDAEPLYNARERGVSPTERMRRAGEYYAGTTGELVMWAIDHLEGCIASITSGLRYYDRSCRPEDTGETQRDEYRVTVARLQRYRTEGK